MASRVGREGFRRGVRRAIAGLVAVAWLAGACGGTPALTEEERNLAARMSEQPIFDDPTVTVGLDEADCLARRAVTDLGGADALAANYGITRTAIADGLNPWQDIVYSPEDADALADATFDCLDMRRVVADRLAGSGLVETSAARCIADEVDMDLLERQAADGYGNTATGGEPLAAAIDADFSTAATTCGVAL